MAIGALLIIDALSAPASTARQGDPHDIIEGHQCERRRFSASTFSGINGDGGGAGLLRRAAETVTFFRRAGAPAVAGTVPRPRRCLVDIGIDAGVLDGCVP
jgi:hypothetical protein